MQATTSALKVSGTDNCKRTRGPTDRPAGETQNLMKNMTSAKRPNLTTSSTYTTTTTSFSAAWQHQQKRAQSKAIVRRTVVVAVGVQRRDDINEGNFYDMLQKSWTKKGKPPRNSSILYAVHIWLIVKSWLSV